MLTACSKEPFLPLDYQEKSDVARLRDYIIATPLLSLILNGIPDGALIITAQRQIVMANRALCEHLQVEEGQVIGLRPGEALGCVHVNPERHDCGSTEFCRYCGAAKVIFQCRLNQRAAHECRIEAKLGSKVLSHEFLVWGTPFEHQEHDYIFLAVADISHEKRRQVLERIFLHDFRNTAGGVLGLAKLLQEETRGPQTEVVSLMVQGMETLLGGIETQRQLYSAENGDLQVNLSPVDAVEAMQKVVKSLVNTPEAQGRRLVVETREKDLMVRTDPNLLDRVLLNLVKNALEACQPGDTVRLGCSNDLDRVRWWVNNPGVMPELVRRQVFKRSYSTKGLGRGLGAYSAKLITERYLQGEIYFSSTPEHGTTFSVCLPPRP